MTGQLTIEQLRYYLDDPDAADAWLEAVGLSDRHRAHANLVSMATSGLTLDLLATIVEQLVRYLPAYADPDRTLNNFDRFVVAARNPLSMGTLFERDPEALPTLLQICATSQYLSDLLISDPESFDLLRETEGQPLTRQMSVERLCGEIAVLDHDRAILRALRRFKHRETLRIAYGDIVRDQTVETVTKQISYQADAILEAALQAAWKRLAEKRGTPRKDDGQPAEFVVLGMGKLGGVELNYSSDIDLIFLYDEDGSTDARRPMSNAEFFERMARELVRLLTETAELGSVYRVDLRLRPDGDQGPMVNSVEGAFHYYDLRGRTWERQAMIKARPVAGSLELGARFLERLRPWIFRRYLSRADISGIRTLKRKIEKRTKKVGDNERDVKTGRGGIRDVEFVIQFLQLVNGGDRPNLQTGNTLDAIVQLENVGCLTNMERVLLETSYRFLRKIEHRLQIMFDLQTHLLPVEPDELRKLALRMGYRDTRKRRALAAFERDFRRRTAENRRILKHLLHDAFPGDTKTAAEADLVLDPDPPEEQIDEVMGKYAFRDARQAYYHLTDLAEEKIRFLSTRRCRLFLAAIAPQLLQAVAATPDPDSTLIHLGQVSDSLGGKGSLWELFSSNPPSLSLYVTLCAYSPYLSGILTSNPGMIDGLMDSLVLDKLPDKELLENRLAELTRSAKDLGPILHSFKNDQQLCVGVRDLLSKEDISSTTAALSHIAETCLGEIVSRESRRLRAKLGTPTIGEGPREGQPCELIVLAMGKLGGRELNYYSDLDLVFLYESSGQTQHASCDSHETTTNQHFFSELAQRIIKRSSSLTQYGRLYEIDARLRPTGKSGPLATSLDEFTRYFAEGVGQLWERLALCKGRVVFGSVETAEATQAAVEQAAFATRWQESDVDEIRQMRTRLEETAGGNDVKRGAGGIVDIEFIVQMLQLKHGRQSSAIRKTNTLDALASLEKAGYLEYDDAEFLTSSYRFLRTLESRLRLMNITARDNLPDDPIELAKLAQLLHRDSTATLLSDVERFTHETRRRFERIVSER